MSGSDEAVSAPSPLGEGRERAAAATDESRVRRALGAIGAAGALLTVTIVAASALLRLATEIHAGEAVSQLPAAVEHAARIAHRLSAMAVGVLAALALVVATRSRPAGAERMAAVAAIVLLTVMLATIGRHTPGYRVMAVTVGNVTGGVLLACAFWWMREQSREGFRGLSMSAFVALVVLVSQAALGAGMSALAMHGEHAIGPLHLWAASVLVVLVGVAAWQGRAHAPLALGAVGLTLLEWGMGFLVMAAGEPRPLALTLTHAVASCVLALVLVSLGCRRR